MKEPDPVLPVDPDAVQARRSQRGSALAWIVIGTLAGGFLVFVAARRMADDPGLSPALLLAVVVVALVVAVFAFARSNARGEP